MQRTQALFVAGRGVRAAPEQTRGKRRVVCLQRVNQFLIQFICGRGTGGGVGGRLGRFGRSFFHQGQQGFFLEPFCQHHRGFALGVFQRQSLAGGHQQGSGFALTVFYRGMKRGVAVVVLRRGRRAFFQQKPHRRSVAVLGCGVQGRLALFVGGVDLCGGLLQHLEGRGLALGGGLEQGGAPGVVTLAGARTATQQQHENERMAPRRRRVQGRAALFIHRRMGRTPAEQQRHQTGAALAGRRVQGAPAVVVLGKHAGASLQRLAGGGFVAFFSGGDERCVFFVTGPRGGWGRPQQKGEGKRKPEQCRDFNQSSGDAPVAAKADAP